MSDVVIRAEKLGKKYTIGHQAENGRYVALRDVLAQNARAIWHRTRDLLQGKPVIAGDTTEEVWALQDVSFEIRQGEVVGIIGRNGAGKSTLLKILSRITEPSAGRVTIRGRVASLLEVGTGFHPELTGRENIYLNGAILGMSRHEIRRKFDEIVAFAEVERYLDTPVKRYSSGMYVRLAFAVAAHLEPELLVIDEVLAVGDVEFQKKCLGKMSEVSQSGRTVLLVSHNMASVMQLAERTAVLDKGQLRYFGPTGIAVEKYMGGIASQQSGLYQVENSPRGFLGTQHVRITALRFARWPAVFAARESIDFSVCMRAQDDVSRMRISMTVFSATGTPVGSCFGSELPGLSQGEELELRVTLPSPGLAPGRYYCGVAIGKGNQRIGHVDYDVVQNVLDFEIQAEEDGFGTLSHWVPGWGSIMFPELVTRR